MYNSYRFAFSDFILLKPIKQGLQKSDFFMAMGGGVRTRNENLVFDTIELRLFYYPKTVELINHYNFKATANFRIRYPTNLVNKPSTVF